MHKRILMLSLAALAMPYDAGALGLGDINVHSALNQSFNAEIELLSARPDELDSLTVTLASSASFAQAGLERPAILTQLRFQVENKANGKPYLHVYSQDPIKEPFLNYLIEVNWASGHLLREYTVLLDPPIEMVAEAPVVQAPAVASNTAITAPVAAPPEAPSAAPSGNTSALPVAALSDAASVPATASSNPLAPPRRSKSLFDSTAPAARVVTTADGSSYGPTQRGEGLWSIAKGLLPGDSSADVNQMMLALLKANPDAFLDNSNINTLKSDYVLRVPTTDELTAVTRQEALNQVNEQSARWKNSVTKVAAQPVTPTDTEAPQQETTAQPTEAQPVPEAAGSSAQLKLLPATESPTAETAPNNAQQQALAAEQQAISGETDVPEGATTPQTASKFTEPTNALDAAQATAIENTRFETLSKNLTLVAENLEAKHLENEELSARLAELEAQTESVQRLIDLKSEQLTALQQTETTPEGAETAAVVNIADKAASQAGAPTAQPKPAAQPKTLIDKAKNIADSGFSSVRKFMGELGSNPVALGIIALAALLLMSLLWVVNRRRRSNSQIIENPGLANEAMQAARIAQSGEATEIESYPLPDNKFEDALSDPNDRHEVQLKLLDIYHLTNSKNAFASQAEALYADLGGKGGPLWDKVIVMGRDICPEHPLFGGFAPMHTDYDDLTVVSAGYNPEPDTDHAIQDRFVEPVEIDAEINGTMEVDAEIDLDTGFKYSSDIPSAGNSLEFEYTPAARPAVSEPAAADDFASYDLVAAEHELEIASPTLLEEPVSEPETSAPVTDFNLDYKFDFDLEKEADLLAKANEELEIPADDQFVGGLEFDSGLVLEADEVGTKLELARAYIEMGDPEGAQSILDEVLSEGDDGQKQEAQTLLLKVG